MQGRRSKDTRKGIGSNLPPNGSLEFDLALATADAIYRKFLGSVEYENLKECFRDNPSRLEFRLAARKLREEIWEDISKLDSATIAECHERARSAYLQRLEGLPPGVYLMGNGLLIVG